MTENKINAICQECGKQFEYNLKPGYPRKYCVECSEIKKASYAAKQPVSQDEQKFNEDMQVPVTKPGQIGMGDPNRAAEKLEIMPKSAPIKEFHLTEEAIRSNALRCAIEMKIQGRDMWSVVKEFEEYIRNGN